MLKSGPLFNCRSKATVAPVRICALVLVLLGGGVTRAQAPATPPAKVKYKTTVLRPFGRTTVTIHYADPDKAEPPGPGEALPITVTITGEWAPIEKKITIKGVKGWQPWLFESASLRNTNGDKFKEFFIRAACHYGGSGGYQYLAVGDMSNIPDGGYQISVLPPVASENIHEGQFFAATNGKSDVVVISTTPLMDNETRADPTHWRVSGYVLNAAAAPTASWEKKPAKRYTEFLPVAAIKAVLPRGWRLGAEIR